MIGDDEYGASWARFGPPVPSAGLPGRTLIYGGTGCNETDYPASRPASNWIAVVDGGTTACTYLRRTEIAQSLNADAVVVAHNADRRHPAGADRPADRRAGRDPGRRPSTRPTAPRSRR